MPGQAGLGGYRGAERGDQTPSSSRRKGPGSSGSSPRWLADIGEVFLFGNVLRQIPAGLQRPGLLIDQMAHIGVGSMPLTVIVALFTGAVTAVQASYQMRDYVPMLYLGTVIGKSVVIELGPVLTALVVGGRVGASIAAELGTMRVTEQVDAMETMGISPVRFLVVPRFLAAFLMLPALTVFADVVAIAGGWLVSILTMDVTSHTFMSGLKLYFKIQDVFSGLMKAFAFGAIIALMGCYFGLRSGGARKSRRRDDARGRRLVPPDPDRRLSARGLPLRVDLCLRRRSSSRASGSGSDARRSSAGSTSRCVAGNASSSSAGAAPENRCS